MSPEDVVGAQLRAAAAIQKLRPGAQTELPAALRAVPSERLAPQILEVLEEEASGPAPDESACDWLARGLIEACGIGWLEQLLALRVPYRAFNQELADRIVPTHWPVARPMLTRALGSRCIDLAKIIFGLLPPPLQAELFPALLELSLDHPAGDLVYLAAVIRQSTHPLASQVLARLQAHQDVSVRVAASAPGSAGTVAATLDSASATADLTSLLGEIERFAAEPIVHAALLRLGTRCDESLASPQREAAIGQVLSALRLVDEGTRSWVERCCHSADPGLRMVAALFLTKLRVPGDEALLAELARDPLSWVRRPALEAQSTLDRTAPAAPLPGLGSLAVERIHVTRSVALSGADLEVEGVLELGFEGSLGVSFERDGEVWVALLEQVGSPGQEAWLATRGGPAAALSEDIELSAVARAREARLEVTRRLSADAGFDLTPLVRAPQSSATFEALVARLRVTGDPTAAVALLEAELNSLSSLRSAVGSRRFDELGREFRERMARCCIEAKRFAEGLACIDEHSLGLPLLRARCLVGLARFDEALGVLGRLPPSKAAQAIREELARHQRNARLAAGDLVTHSKFGEGVVERVAGDGDACKATVRFASGAPRTLLARFLTRAR